VISAVPGEGKSTISVNLANLFASGGQSTLLIDGDLRNPELSRHLGVGAKRGLIEVIAGTTPLAEATLEVPQSVLRFLPAVLQGVKAQIGELCGFSAAENSEHAALVVEMVVRDSGHALHDCSTPAVDCAAAPGESSQSSARKNSPSAVSGNHRAPPNVCSAPKSQ